MTKPNADEIAMRVVKRYAGHAVVDVVAAVVDVVLATRGEAITTRLLDAQAILAGGDVPKGCLLTDAEVAKLLEIRERYSPPEPKPKP